MADAPADAAVDPVGPGAAGSVQCRQTMRRYQPSRVLGRTSNTDQRRWEQPAQHRKQRTVTGLQAAVVLVAQDRKLLA